jgi:hypothetical protein
LSTSFKRTVERGYGFVAESYLATKFANDPATLAALEDLTRDLPPGAAVLDLGFGAGVRGDESWLWAFAKKPPRKGG